ncbi:MAG: DUF2807 domain-containing protein [Bacteroidales bacterium]|nr:DUF2807 domain-containing protein [Bacteroidales bacterium]
MKTFLLSCFAALLALIGLNNCAVATNSDVITQNVRVLEFYKIEVNGIDAQIRYSQSDINEVNVTTNEYLHDMLSIVVDVNTLVIKPTDKYKKNRKKATCLIIDITSTNIEMIKNNSNSNIQFMTEINTPELRIENIGKGSISGMKSVDVGVLEIENTNAGNITMVGKIEKAEILLLGTGKLNLENCSIKRCKCEHSGVGDVYVYAVDTLDVNIFGKGNVYYMGEPKIKQEILGTGRLIKR